MRLPDGVKMTPMLKQYTEWKDRYPDCILMFRMGDFFEMFFDDAVTASEALDITLTARDQDKNIPMAGVPHHSVDSYIGRLIKAGFKVAMCDQITEPDGKSLVERKVIRVVTPGTYVPQDSDGDGKLAGISFDGERASIALLTSGTGSLRAGTLPLEEAVSHISSFGPGELLIPKGQEAELTRHMADFGHDFSAVSTVSRERGEFSPAFASQWLCKRWNVATLRAMDMEDADPACGSAAAVLRYLEETQFGGGDHVHEIRPILPGGMLILDQTTQTNLELVADDEISLYSVLNKCKTPMGKRLLRDWILHPSIDTGEISFRQDCIENLCGNASLLRKLADALSRCRDIERALARLSMKVGNPKDVGVVRDTLAALPSVANLISESGASCLESIFQNLPDLSGLSGLLSSALADDPPRLLTAGGVIRDGFDSELDESRDAIKNAEENLRAFEAGERERTGIKLKVGINKVFGYYIEIGKNYADKVPDDYIRRQTVASGERYVNERLKDIERRVYRAEHEIGEREQSLYNNIVRATLAMSMECQRASAALAKVDVLRSLAEVARDNSYSRPVVDDSRIFYVKGGRHPVVEKALGSAPFTPNDVDLDPDALSGRGCVGILTGPNMAGKSTYLRMTALIAIMAHMGSFVPAESARIGRLDRIFTRIGARDELARGRSTFMVEMVETANILRHVTDRSLVVLDEIGRGTSTYDGMSIAWAVVEFLALHVENRTKALFATHYHELTGLSLPQLLNLSMAVEESKDGIRFLHKVVSGPADRSYGVEVARLAGVPNIVVKRSQELLAQLEEEHATADENIETMSRKYVQKEIFFDVEREGIIEQLAASDPDRMTPMEALDLIFKLRKKSRKILDMK